MVNDRDDEWLYEYQPPPPEKEEGWTWADYLSLWMEGDMATPDPERKAKPNIFQGWLRDFWENVASFFISMFENVWAGFRENILNIFKETSAQVESQLSRGEDAAWEAIFKLLTDQGILDKETVENLAFFKGLPFPLNTAMYVVAIAAVLGAYLMDLGRIVGMEARYDLMEHTQGEIPDFREVIQAAFVAPEKTGDVRAVMKRGGLKDDYIDMLFLAAYRVYPEETVRLAFLRGVLNEDEMFMRMRELGYTDTRIKEIIQTWDVIPGPADLFHLVAKEAFEPDMIAKMGLDDEFPVEQVEWLKKQGVSEEWARKYWYAHWEQPSIEMGFEMLHRGIIDYDTLDMLFRTVEIPPFWREKLTKIAFNPFTRVDARRMHDLGVLKDHELVKVYMDQGYDEWHAERMADFTIRYNRQHEKELTKAQIITGYKEKLMTKNDALDLLMQLDYKEAQAEYLLLLEDYKEAKDLQDDLIDNIKDRYQNNLFTDFEARAKLNELNLPAVQVDVLMDKWKIKRFEDRKLPSKSDLDKMVKARIINEDTYRLEMQKLGYGWDYINWYWQLASGKKGG